MATADENKFLRSGVSVFTGTAGAVASTPVGIIDEEDGVEFESDQTVQVFRPQGHDLPLNLLSRGERAALLCTFSQLELALAEIAYNQAATGQIITFGDVTDGVIKPKISVAAVAQLADGTAFRYDLPFASAGGESLAVLLGQAALSKLPVRFEALSDPNLTSFPTLTIGAGNLTATISTGTFDRGSSAFIFVRGEGFLADTLTDVTGTPALVDNELLTLQMGGAEVITITHAVGVIELFGAIPFVMAAGDQITLQYDLAGTVWEEKTRFQVTPA